MSGHRGLFWLAVLTAVAAAIWYRSTVFTPPAVVEKPVIALLVSGSTPYWQLTTSGAKAAAARYNVDLRIEQPEGAESLEQQTQSLLALDLDEVNGVAFSPVDPEGVTRLINTLAQQTLVVTLDADAPLSMRQCHIGTSNVAAGRLCARLVEEAVPDGGKVAVLLANVTKSTNIDRKSAFEKSLGRDEDAPPSDEPSKYVLLEPLIDDGDDDKCRQLIKERLASDPDLACFVALNARQGPLLLEVLKAEGQLGKIKLITFDEAEETLRGIEDGHIFATIAQNPYMYGYETIRRLASLCRGEKDEVPIAGGGTIHVTAEAIRRENLDDFRKRLRERLPTAEAGDDGDDKGDADAAEADQDAAA